MASWLVGKVYIRGARANLLGRRLNWPGIVEDRLEWNFVPLRRARRLVMDLDGLGWNRMDLVVFGWN